MVSLAKRPRVVSSSLGRISSRARSKTCAPFPATRLIEAQFRYTQAFLQFLSFMWNPLSWVMEGAALVAIALSNGEGRPPECVAAHLSRRHSS